jgi:hypothetical protein
MKKILVWQPQTRLEVLAQLTKKKTTRRLEPMGDQTAMEDQTWLLTQLRKRILVWQKASQEKEQSLFPVTRPEPMEVETMVEPTMRHCILEKASTC